MNIKAKKKYTLKDQRDDLERLELLLVSLEAPIDYKKVYTKIFINDNLAEGPASVPKSYLTKDALAMAKDNIQTMSEESKIPSPSAKNNNIDNDRENYYYDIHKGNLIWLNHNLSVLNKRNIKLIETLKLIQRILKKI